MLDHPIVDVALGLILLYTVLSLLASIVKEWISTLLGLRAKNLEKGIKTLTLECLDDVIVHFVSPGHHPVRIGIEVPLDEVVHVDQREQLPCLRPWREARRGVHEIRRQRRPLVVLNDADDHRTRVSADHGAASALGVKEVLAGLEHFVRHSVEARPQVEAEGLATTRTDHVDVPEADPVDHTQPVVFGLGEDGVDGQLQPHGEVVEPGVGRGLRDYRVPCQEDAPGFFPVPVVPALLFRQLDRGGGAGGEGDLVDLASSLDGEAVSAEGLVDGGGVLVYLGHGADAELAEGEDEGVGGGGGRSGSFAAR